MDGLAEFYSARLDEDEAAARADRDAPEGALRYSDIDEWGAPLAWLMTSDRALREVEAGRALLRAYEASVRSVGEGLSGQLGREVARRAAVWYDHPDYRAEWKP